MGWDLHGYFKGLKTTVIYGLVSSVSICVLGYASVQETANQKKDHPIEIDIHPIYPHVKFRSRPKTDKNPAQSELEIKTEDSYCVMIDAEEQTLNDKPDFVHQKRGKDSVTYRTEKVADYVFGETYRKEKDKLIKKNIKDIIDILEGKKEGIAVKGHDNKDITSFYFTSKNGNTYIIGDYKSDGITDTFIVIDKEGEMILDILKDESQDLMKDLIKRIQEIYPYYLKRDISEQEKVKIIRKINSFND